MHFIEKLPSPDCLTEFAIRHTLTFKQVRNVGKK